MECAKVHFSGHAVRRMFARSVSEQEVLAVLRAGERIADYPNDRPYPSALLLGLVDDRPLHVVVAQDPDTHDCIVITAYPPDPALWEPGNRKRRSP